MESLALDQKTENNQENLQTKQQMNLCLNEAKNEKLLFGEKWLAYSLIKAKTQKDIKFIESNNLIDPRILQQPSLKEAFFYVINNSFGFIEDSLIYDNFNEQMRALSRIYKLPHRLFQMID